MSKSWFSIRALSESEAEVSIYDQIGLWGVSARDFAAQLKAHAGRALTVRINSPGGVVTEGTAIFNALRRHNGPVTTHIDGLAASMATYIALAGSTVKMAENSYFMIHNPSGGVGGEAKDMRRYADLLDKMKATLVAAYVAKTGKDDAEIEKMMDDETWLTAEEAKDFGFIDEVTDPIEAAAVAQFDLKGFRNAPAALVPVDTSVSDKMTVEQLTARVSELESQLAEATNKHTAAANQAQANFAQLTEAKNQITALTTEREGLKTEIETLKASAVTASQRAVEIAASVGVPPIDADKPEGKGGKQAPQMTLAEYQALHSSKKAEFRQKGGTIVDTSA